MQKMTAILFTDGSSRGNPGPGGWGTIVSLPDRVVELGGNEKTTTNNRMELTAIARGLQAVPATMSETIIYTDSKYAMQGATQWIHGWKRTGWQTKAGSTVSNRDLWEEIADAMRGKHITWNVIGGHVGIPGNERVDVIATSFADNTPVALYDGDPVDYPVDLDKLVGEEKSHVKKDRSKQKAFSYLSLVAGEAMRHKTWATCEARVKGVAGAKYRKSISLDDELDILHEWSVSPQDVEDEPSSEE
jgi:ribonuclease HI